MLLNRNLVKPKSAQDWWCQLEMFSRRQIAVFQNFSYISVGKWFFMLNNKFCFFTLDFLVFCFWQKPCTILGSTYATIVAIIFLIDELGWNSRVLDKFGLLIYIDAILTTKLFGLIFLSKTLPLNRLRIVLPMMRMWPHKEFGPILGRQWPQCDLPVASRRPAVWGQQVCQQNIFSMHRIYNGVIYSWST